MKESKKIYLIKNITLAKTLINKTGVFRYTMAGVFLNIMKALQFIKFFFISVPLACTLYSLVLLIQLIKKI